MKVQGKRFQESGSSKDGGQEEESLSLALHCMDLTVLPHPTSFTFGGFVASHPEVHSQPPFRLDPSPFPRSPNTAGEQSFDGLESPWRSAAATPHRLARDDAATDSSDLGQHTVSA